MHANLYYGNTWLPKSKRFLVVVLPRLDNSSGFDSGKE